MTMLHGANNEHEITAQVRSAWSDLRHEDLRARGFDHYYTNYTSMQRLQYFARVICNSEFTSRDLLERLAAGD